MPGTWYHAPTISWAHSVSGPADIVALDNGDPTSFEPFHGDTRSAFNGLALASCCALFQPSCGGSSASS
jgi:hypothetical protein